MMTTNGSEAISQSTTSGNRGFAGWIWASIAIIAAGVLLAFAGVSATGMIVGISAIFSFALATAFRIPGTSTGTVFFWCLAILCGGTAAALPLIAVLP